MLEVLVESFWPANLFFTVFLILMLIYWLMVILGALDFDFLDIDFDSDVDADIDVDADADMEVTGGFLRGFLEFFYVGEVPVMILVSIFALSAWTISVLSTHYLNPSQSVILLVPLVAGNLLVSSLVVKLVGVPMKKIFKSFEDDPNAPRKVMGRICKIITTDVTSERMGQAEVPGKGAPILLNVITEGDQVFHKGDEAIIVGQNKETGVHKIGPVDL